LTVSLVTGSNRGIGREVARQLAAQGHRVIVTSRSGEKAKRAASEIGAAFSHDLDTSNASSIDALLAFVKKEVGRLDVLVNNAAIAGTEHAPVADIDPSEFELVWRTNTLGPFLLMKAFTPMLRDSGHGRIVNVSSGAGQLSKMSDYAPAYSISKTALNALTVQFANALKPDGVLVNSVCPGWVRTDMGGSNATRSVEEGADGIVWAATLPDNGPTGGFFRDGERIPW
jgi:NAD(P)-dependent dehydrogenase (short-subunit alcohol dehydrogenase family)